MDSIKPQKLQAMKNYKKAQFLYNLIVYSLTALLSCLFYSYLFWFPTMGGHFFSVFLPNISSFFLSPKFLFIVGNVIVFILVGESKLGGSQYSSLATESYDAYVQRSRRLRQRSMIVDIDNKKREYFREPQMQSKIEKKSINRDEKSVYHEEEILKIQQTSNNGEEAVGKVDAMEAKLGGGREEEEKLFVIASRDELNRRVEEFIARVNRQRRFEEGQVLNRF